VATVSAYRGHEQILGTVVRITRPHVRFGQAYFRRYTDPRRSRRTHFPPGGAREDPLVLRTQVLDASDNPVANKRLVIRARPRPRSSAKSFFVGSGYSDANGMAHASIDLSHVVGGAGYKSPSGGVELDVYYWDSAGTLQLGRRFSAS
jgi:hypothetical protein